MSIKSAIHAMAARLFGQFTPPLRQALDVWTVKYVPLKLNKPATQRDTLSPATLVSRKARKAILAQRRADVRRQLEIEVMKGNV
jgi:hypothetical protein